MSRDELINTLSKELIIELTAGLVEIPTRNPPGEEKAGAEYIHDRLQGWGIETELIREPDPERPQVVAWLRGAGDGPTVVLNGHIDTVGEGEREQWTKPPFELTREEGRLYGLGACDMKGSLGVALAIFKALHDAQVDFEGTLMLQAVMGEEMDEDGTRTLLRRGYTGDYAIVLEPTDLRIGPATRGVTWYRVTLTGPSMHCGLAAADSPDLMYGFAQLVEEFEAYHRRVSASSHHLVPSPGCRLTDVQAGGVHNDLVGGIEFVIDRRMIPGETREGVGKEIEEILELWAAERADFSFEIEFLDWNEPTEAPLDSPLLAALQENSEAILGQPAAIWGPPYGSDVRVFLHDRGIPAVNFGAGDFRVCHRPDEFVPEAQLMDCGRIVMGTVLELLRSD